FGTTKVAEASRNLSLRRVTQIDLAAQITGLGIMLTWAYFDRSIWALVAGSVLASVASAVLGHIWLPGTPNRWHWDRVAFVELIHFGKWIFASSTLGFLVASCDRLLLGWLVDSAALGVYVIAFTIYSVIDQVIAQIAVGVSLPALSEVVRAHLDL